MSQDQTGGPPERGQLVQVRNRPALVTNVASNEDYEESLHLVNVDYLDGNEHPDTDQILWEVEPSSGYMENAGWPDINQFAPDREKYYDAYTDSVRWTSLQSVQSLLDTEEDLPLISLNIMSDR